MVVVEVEGVVWATVLDVAVVVVAVVRGGGGGGGEDAKGGVGSGWLK